MDLFGLFERGCELAAPLCDVVTAADLIQLMVIVLGGALLWFKLRGLGKLRAQLRDMGDGADKMRAAVENLDKRLSEVNRALEQIDERMTPLVADAQTLARVKRVAEIREDARRFVDARIAKLSDADERARLDGMDRRNYVRIVKALADAAQERADPNGLRDGHVLVFEDLDKLARRISAKPEEAVDAVVERMERLFRELTQLGAPRDVAPYVRGAAQPTLMSWLADQLFSSKK